MLQTVLGKVGPKKVLKPALPCICPCLLSFRSRDGFVSDCVRHHPSRAKRAKDVPAEAFGEGGLVAARYGWASHVRRSESEDGRVMTIINSDNPPAIAPAPTSIALFVGWAPSGPLDKAVRTKSLADYVTAFGKLDDKRSLLGYAVSHFFDNGGQRCLCVAYRRRQRQCHRAGRCRHSCRR